MAKRGGLGRGLSALIPGAAEAVAALRADGRRVGFLSNKPLQTREDYAAKLSRLGVPASADDVINSSLVLARHLRASLAHGDASAYGRAGGRLSGFGEGSDDVA